MSANRYLTISATTGGLAQAVPATVGGTGNANQLVALNASGVLDSTMLPAGVGATAATVITSAALSAGNLVNIYSNSGVATARPADNTNAASAANGFVLAAVASGANATVFTPGEIVTGLASLTPGATYYLGTAGAITATQPTAPATLQVVGEAISATSLLFAPHAPILLV